MRYLVLLALMSACATAPAQGPVIERQPAILMPAQIRGAALFPEELEMVRRATADFLRRQTDVPVTLVSDLTLAAVTQKHRNDPDATGTIADAWRAAVPDALEAIVTAQCSGDDCVVIVAVGGRDFVAPVIAPKDTQTWVAAAGSLAVAVPPPFPSVDAPTAFGAGWGAPPTVGASSCAGPADVVVETNAVGVARCHAHARAGVEQDAAMKCHCASVAVKTDAPRRYVVVTP